MKRVQISLFALFVLVASSTNFYLQSTVAQPQRAEAEIGSTGVFLRLAAVRDKISMESEYLQADEGSKFIAIQVVIENRSGDDWAVRPDNLRIKDSEGNVYEPKGSILGLYEIVKPTLKPGILDPKDLVRGWVAFEVGNDVEIKGMRVRYEDHSPLSDAALTSAWIIFSSVLR